MLRQTVLCILVVIFALASSIEARRWRPPPPPRWGWATRTVCTPNCSFTRSCTPGGCASWSTRHTHFCAQHGTTSHCAHYQDMKEQICVSHNARCAQWNYINQNHCARYATQRTPIVKLVDGQCVSHKTRCVAYRREGKTKCLKWGKRCTGFFGGAIRRCVQWNAATSTRTCAQWQDVTETSCQQYANQCAQFKDVTATSCAQQSQQCTQWALKEQIVAKPVCAKKAKRCLRHKSYKIRRCRKYIRTGVCARYATKTRKVCSRAVRKCVGYRTYKHRVCVRGVRKCAKYFTQKLGTKCAVWKYRKSSQKRCVSFGKKWIKGSRKCIRWSRPRCLKFASVAIYRRGRIIRRKRRCAIRAKRRRNTLSRRRRGFRKSVKRKIRRAFRRVRRAKRRTSRKLRIRRRRLRRRIRVRRRRIRRRVRRFRRSRRCRIFRSKKFGRIVKRCGRVIYGCTVRFTSKKSGRTHVCCGKVIRTNPVKPVRRCLKYSTRKGYFKRFCKKQKTVVLRSRYCAKRVARTRRVCIRWRGKCAQYAHRTRKICNKVRPKCVAYKRVKSQYCALFRRKCAKTSVTSGTRCVRWGKKCIAFRLDKQVVGHLKQCIRVSKVCTKVNTHTFRLCARYQKVCAQQASSTRRVCARFEKRTTPRTCARYATIYRCGCNGWTRYCKQAATTFSKKCIRRARYCTGYRKVFKTVGYKTRQYCAQWAVRQVPTTCVRYAHSCTRAITRITGRRCAQWVHRTACVRTGVHSQQFCAHHVPPRCHNVRSCSQTCQTVRVQVRSDIHLQQLGGKWIDFNYAGVFDYFGHGPCDAQIRLQRLKSGSIGTGVAVKCNDQVFRATPSGIFVNDQAVTDSATFGSNGKVTKLAEHQFRLETGFGLNIRVDLEKKFGLVSIGFHEIKQGTEFKDSGLMMRGSEQYPEDYVVPKEESLFHRYVKFQEIPVRTNVSARERKQAQDRCAKVLTRGTKAHKQCVFDLLATGINMAVAYANEQSMLKK